MKKINKKELKIITEKLKPYWKKYGMFQSQFLKKIAILEKEMNKNINLKTKLEFFYCDGECVGIGAEDHSERKFFPLISDTELNYV